MRAVGIVRGVQGVRIYLLHPVVYPRYKQLMSFLSAWLPYHCPDKSCNHLIVPTDHNCPGCGQELVPWFWNMKLRSRTDGGRQYCPCCGHEVWPSRRDRVCDKCGVEMLLPLSEEMTDILVHNAIVAVGLLVVYALVKFIKWAWYN